jgi:hypothetical protein
MSASPGPKPESSPSRHPYTLAADPKVTIRKVLIWIARKPDEVALEDVAEKFGISSAYASVILLKLHRWGYLRRWKDDLPPRTFRYEASAFGLKTAKKWGK